jgi:DNA-binding NtrC family response regulator
MFETVVCSSLRESEALLGEKDFGVIFCEDRFADGAYPELLSVIGRSHKIPIVVMISNVEEDSVFREAMALGAFGVVPKPCSTKDAQWMVIRATQGGANSFKSTLSSGNASGAASNGPRRK